MDAEIVQAEPKVHLVMSAQETKRLRKLLADQMTFINTEADEDFVTVVINSLDSQLDQLAD